MKSIFVFLPLCLASLFVYPACAQLPNICVVPVNIFDISQSKSPIPAGGIFEIKTFPKSPWPIFYWGGYSYWHLNRQNQLVKTDTGFPNSYFDIFTQEPSGRVIGITHGNRNVFIQDASSGVFYPHGMENMNDFDEPISLAWVDFLEGTLITTGNHGLYLLKNNNLSAFKFDEPELEKKKIVQVFDLPMSHMSVLKIENGGLVLLSQSGRIQEIPGFPSSSYFENWISGIREIKNPPGLVVNESENEDFIPLKNNNGVLRPLQAINLGKVTFPGMAGTRESSHYYPMINANIIYGQVKHFFWSDKATLLHLHNNRWEAIEGGSDFSPILGIFVNIIESRRIIIFSGVKGLYAYDGINPVQFIASSDSEKIGQDAHVYDLPALGKVLITTTKGLFELATDNEILPVKLPKELQGDERFEKIVELASVKSAILLTSAGAYIIDAMGTISGPIEKSSDNFILESVPIPMRNEVFVSERNRAFIITQDCPVH